MLAGGRAALTDDHVVLRVGTDELGSLAGGQRPRGQGPLGVAVRVVQVQAVDVAAPQRRLALHGTRVAEISCKDRDGRAQRGCGVSLTEDISEPSGHNSVPCAVQQPCLSKTLVTHCGPFQPNPFCDFVIVGTCPVPV